VRRRRHAADPAGRGPRSHARAFDRRPLRDPRSPRPRRHGAWSIAAGNRRSVARSRSRSSGRAPATTPPPPSASLREAKLASSLSQPSTVSVIDFGQTEDGILYLVMELLRGRTLADVLRADGRLGVERAARIAVQVCDALEAAHRGRHRPPRSQAGQRDDPRRSAPAAIWSRSSTSGWPRSSTPTSRPSRSRGAWSGRRRTCLPRSRSARPRRRGAISTRSACCCSRCSTVGCPSSPTTST
jgi:hypothetical protein